MLRDVACKKYVVLSMDAILGKHLLVKVSELIPKLKTRQNKGAEGNSSGSSSTGNKKKGKKR